MKIKRNRRFCLKYMPLLLMVIMLLLACDFKAIAQEPTPRPITATATKSLIFGSFYQGASGGTVTVSSAGIRTFGGTVVLLTGSVVSQATFEIVGNIGTPVSFLLPNSTLTDGNGHSLSLEINDTNPGTPFVLTNDYPNPTSLNVGGSLTIGNPSANPPGSYNGTFEITFVQE